MKQRRISSFFRKASEKKETENFSEEDSEIVENTPGVEAKKRRNKPFSSFLKRRRLHDEKEETETKIEEEKQNKENKNHVHKPENEDKVHEPEDEDQVHEPEDEKKENKVQEHTKEEEDNLKDNTDQYTDKDQDRNLNENLKNKQIENEFTRIKTFVSSNLSPSLPSSTTSILSETFGRHKIETLKKTPSEILIYTESKKIIKVRGSWTHNTELSVGDVINVIVEKTDTEENSSEEIIIIDDYHGLLIVHPDILISGTSLISSMFCKRKTVLSERYKGLEKTSKTMFIGTVVHELFQKSLVEEVGSTKEMEEIFDELTNEEIIHSNLAALQMTISELKREISPFLPHIQYFIQKYTKSQKVNVPKAAFPSTSPLNEWLGVVESICDIEENILAPRLGLKGKVDCTVQVKLHKKDKQGRVRKIMPLELKTGRASGSLEHRGQVILYSLMMSEIRPDPFSGLLLYLRNSSLFEISAGPHEKRDLLQLRNLLAVHFYHSSLSHHTILPSPISIQAACSKCSYLTVCAASNTSSSKTLEKDSIEYSLNSSSFIIPTALSHLTTKDLEFFHEMNELISCVQRSLGPWSPVSHLWNTSPQERVLESKAVFAFNLEANQGHNEFSLSLLPYPSSSSSFSALKVPFSPGETVILSSISFDSSESLLSISQGVILRLSQSKIDLRFDKNIRSLNNKSVIYILDKNEFYGSYSSSTGLSSLAKLMEDSPKASYLRSLIIHSTPISFLSGLPSSIAIQGKSILKTLNSSQQKAIFRILMANDFVLLRGFPGTGKTTLLVALLRLLSLLGKKTLLTSHTHSGVDNLLIKLIPFQIPFTRLGKKNKVDSRLHPWLYSKSSSSSQIIGTTCLSLSHHFITHFDFAIVDEACQSPFLSTLGPLFHADRFLLVGDPLQIAPIFSGVSSSSSLDHISLFSRLEKSHPSSVISLSTQYRMNARIMGIVNILTYKHSLICGSKAIESYVIPPPPSPSYSSSSSLVGEEEEKKDSLMTFVTNSKIERSVLFLHVETPGAITENEREGKILQVILQKWTLRDFGILSPFRAQVSLLKTLFPSKKYEECISTIDQFQGRDKEIIFLSCVRNVWASNCILRDEKRLNVALTRAKGKIILLGNYNTLSKYEPFAQLLRQLSPEDRYDCTEEDFL